MRKRGIASVLIQAAQSESIWHNAPIRLTDGGFWSSWLGGASSSGRAVGVNDAMKLSAVWACVRLVSMSVAGLPIGVYKRKSDGGRESANDHPLYALVHVSPNEDMTPMQFWQAMVAAMMLWGNTYARIQRIGKRAVALEFLLPSRVRLDCDDLGRLRYFFRPRSGAEIEIARTDILHIPAFSLDGRIGLSAIRYGVDVMGAAMSAEDAANGTFKNGLMPTVAFSVDRTMNSKQREEFREYVAAVSGALNAGRAPVLEHGVKPESIGINPNDAQLLESRGWSTQEICRWFGVPPWMVGYTDKGSNWGTGLEQQMLAFLTFVITSYTTQIQQCINKRLLEPKDWPLYYAEYSLEGFLRADSASRAAFYSSMAQNGVYTRDDIREKENLPRKGGNAEVLTVQSNLLPLDRLGESSDSNSVRSALSNWLKTAETQE
ncbi:phage portal protein [Castellaniella hirudinis]|uniref:phage portal protein n=1 Tax=Castellaniella hirudinis TaxID=1144617 RepID=UPI0039C055A8